MSALHRLRCWRQDRRGVTAVEFALIAPVMILVMFGLFDMCFQIYAQSILSGAVQRAGRDSALEGNSPISLSLIDQKVTNAVKSLIANAIVTSDRKTYSSFSNIAPEPFTDSNHNGLRDPGECFSDINNNGIWDADAGSQGQGGANDVTVYTVTVKYRPFFPLAYVWWGTAQQTLTATTVLKNQPYGTQATATPPTVCT